MATPAIRASIGLHAVALPGALLWPSEWPWWLGLLAADHAALAVAGLWPQSRVLGPNLVRLPGDGAARGEVALTFDDGPDPEVTPRVLDMLDRQGARASFFCVGTRAAAYPAIVREIVRRGHTAENHSHTHPHAFACLGPGAIRNEIGRAQAAITAAAGVTPCFFRPPAGLRNPLLAPVLSRMGLAYVSWTRRGFDGVRGDAGAVLRRLLRGLSAGDILLLHDCARPLTRRGQPVVLEVLPELLDQLAAARLRAVSLPPALTTPRRCTSEVAA